MLCPASALLDTTPARIVRPCQFELNLRQWKVKINTDGLLRLYVDVLNASHHCQISVMPGRIRQRSRIYPA